MAVTISLISRKGGVGKTSLCVHLAGLLARDGCRVRVVDLDPQCSLSQFFLGAEAVENIHPRSTIDAVVTGRQTADQVQVPTRTHRLTLVPAHLGFEAPKNARLDIDSEDIDLQLLDTPPDLLNPIVRAALAASHFALSPVQAEIMGVQSIVSVQRALHGVALATNPRLRLLGYVVNQRQRLSIHAAIEEMLRRLHGDNVFQTVIPSLAAFKEASLAQCPISEHNPKSAACKAIARLAEEILDRIDRMNQGDQSQSKRSAA